MILEAVKQQRSCEPELSRKNCMPEQAVGRMPPTGLPNCSGSQRLIKRLQPVLGTGSHLETICFCGFLEKWQAVSRWPRAPVFSIKVIADGMKMLPDCCQ